MGIVRNLLVRVGADLSDLQKKLKQAQKMFKNLGKDLNKIGESMTKKMTVPIVAVGTAFAMMGLKAAKAADDLADLSMVTNIGVEDLQAYAYVGDILGTDLDTITGAQTKLTRAIAEAHGGNKDAIQAFQDLGVQIYDTDGKLRSADEIFWDVLDALGKIEDPVLRDATAMELMGKSAQDLNPLIAAGSEEIKKYMDRAKELGIIMSEDQVMALAELNDSWSTLKTQFEAVGNMIMATLAPALQNLIDNISDKLPAATQYITDMVKAFLELDPSTQTFILSAIGLLAALGPIILVFGKIAAGISAVIGWVSGIIAAWGALGAGTGTLGGILTAVFGSIGGVVVAVIAIIAALILIFKHLWDTNEEFKAGVIAIWEAIKAAVLPIIQSIWDFLVLVFTEVSTFIMANMGTIQEIFTTAWLIIQEIFKLALQAIIDNMTPVIEFLKKLWKDWGDTIVGFFKLTWENIKVVIETALGIISGVLKIGLGILKGDWETVWEGIKQVFKSIWDGIVGIVENSWKAITGIVDGIVNKVKDAINWVKELIGLNSSATGSMSNAQGTGALQSGIKAGIPKLADGGILTSPTLAIAGEAGPEAVIPLSKLDSMIGSGDKGTVVQVILDGRVVQEFVDNGLGNKSLAFGGAY